MAPNESIKELFTWFILIVSNLYFFRKSFTNKEKFQNIQRCLSKSKWGLKVTAKEKAHYFKRLTLDDLLDKLLIHELTMQEDD